MKVNTYDPEAIFSEFTRSTCSILTILTVVVDAYSDWTSSPLREDPRSPEGMLFGMGVSLLISRRQQATPYVLLRHQEDEDRCRQFRRPASRAGERDHAT
jgi:hypothetical protein